MPRLKTWLPAIGLAALFLLSVALCAKADAPRGGAPACLEAAGVAFVLERDAPGTQLYATLSGAEFLALNHVIGAPAGIAALEAWSDPLAQGPEGPVLLVIFYDSAGCLAHLVEIPRARFDALLARGRGAPA